MLLESILVSVGVVSVFAIFAAVLAWGGSHGTTSQQPTANSRKRRAF